METAYERLSPGSKRTTLDFSRRRTSRAVCFTRASRAASHARSGETPPSQAYQYNQFTASGLPVTNWTELYLFAEFNNRMTVSADTWADNVMTAYCDRCARGGPAVRASPDANILINVGWDPRRMVVPTLAAIYTVGDYGKSTLWRVRPYVTVRARSNLSWELGTRYQRNRNDTQWFANLGTIGSDTTHYVFAHLDQELLSFTSRLNYTATTALSLQLYAEPFLTTGRYFNVRELASPRAASYDARYRPFPLATDDAALQHQGAARERGSALGVPAWFDDFPGLDPGPEQDDRNAGTFVPSRDFKNLFAARPDNTFLDQGIVLDQLLKNATERDARCQRRR